MSNKIIQPSEHDEQVALFMWIKYQPEICDIAYAVPNGGLRNKIVAVKLKKEGVRAGLPDVVIPIPRKGFGALYIEMKVRKGGKVSAIQKERMEALSSAGNCVVVCNGAEQAIDEITEYMGLRGK